MADTYTSDDGNAFKVRKGTGRRMKKHRVKLKSDADKKTKGDVSSVPSGPVKSDGEHIKEKAQEGETEVVVHPVRETAIDEPSVEQDAVDSSAPITDSSSQVQEKKEVEEESHSELTESHKNNGQVKSDLECPSEEGGCHDMRESENSSPAESRVSCDVHIQDIIVEVNNSIPIRNCDDDENDLVESTDL